MKLYFSTQRRKQMIFLYFVIVAYFLLLILALANKSIGIGIFILNKLPVAKVPLMLVINSNDPCVEGRIIEIIKRYAKNYTVKSRNMAHESLDLIIEIRTGDGSNLLKDILSVEGITSASLLSHDGEVTV